MKRALLTVVLIVAVVLPRGFASAPIPIIETNSRCLAWAQSLTDDILTPRIIACQDWLQAPVIQLNTDETLEFSFDAILHNYRRYTCHFEHCNANWEPSGLQYSEYMEGFDDEELSNWEISMNTNFEYTHYSLTFPSEMNSPRISGNYMLTVLEDDQPAVRFRFCVVEQIGSISATAATTTDVDTRQTHQQVTASTATGSLGCFSPAHELKLTVMQNLRFDNAAIGTVPDFVQGDKLAWQHTRPLIFKAGNGMRRFELTNVYTGMQHVDRIAFDGTVYHAYLEADDLRRQFIYDNDHHGHFYVHSTSIGADDPDTQADYVMVHFTLDSPWLDGGHPYLNFLYDAGSLSKRYRMEYDEPAHRYTLAVPLKMGAYDYQYLWVPDGAETTDGTGWETTDGTGWETTDGTSGETTGGTGGETGRIEGDFYNTDNSYLLLLYLHRPSDRYDRLIATSTIGITN